MKVAMIGSRGFTVYHSGLEAHVRDLAHCLASDGCGVRVYGRHGSRFTRFLPEQSGNAPVEYIDGYHMPGKITGTISNSLWATRHAIKSQCFDILHYHGVGCTFAMLLAKRYNIPTVISLHSTNWQENKWSGISKTLIHRLERRAVQHADEVIVVSEALATRIHGEYGVKPHVIPNGVRIKGLPEMDKQVLAGFGLEKGKYILYVGRIVPDKGCHILLQGFKKAAIPIKLVLVGPRQDRDYWQHLKSNAGDEVIMPGPLYEQKLGTLYRNCWLFCSASVSEGQPIALLEALAHGAQCLVSDIPGHQELVTEPNLRFGTGDASDLSAKILALHTRRHDGRRILPAPG